MELWQYTTSPLGGAAKWNFYNAPPHYLGVVGSATLAMRYLIAWGQGGIELVQYTASVLGGSQQCPFCNTVPHCVGQWVLQLVPCTATPPSGGKECLPQCNTSLLGRTGQPNSCNAVPHYLGAVGSGTLAMLCLTAQGQWAVQLLPCTASLPGGNGQCNACIALPPCLGAVGG